MLAIIRTGGKQFIVTPGEKIKIEKIDKKEGSEITFDEVLLLEKGKKLEIGNPLVKGVKVIGKIISQRKEKKKIVFKWKAKSHYQVKRGHRQPFTEVEITKVETD